MYRGTWYTPVHTKAQRVCRARAAVVGAAEASREAQVVRDDDRRVEALKVENEDRLVIEARLRLHDQWQRLHRRLAADLLARGRDLRTRRR